MTTQKQNQKEQFLFQEGQIQNETISIIESHFDKQYLNLMKTHNIQNLTQITKFLANANQQQIHFLNKNLIKNSFSCIRIFSTINQIIQIFEIELASFKLQLTVFKAIGRDFMQFRNLTQYLNNGRFGKVYKFSANFLQRDIAIKSISKIGKNNTSLIQVIKQCSFLKLFSAFQAGIPYNKLFGFDIIQTEQNFMISMENGVQLNQYLNKYDKTLNQLQNELNELQQSLFKVHLFQITHCDIKPQNIVYSPSLKKIVFIDFGLSQCKINKIGTSLKQQFKGSLFYCSPQMKNLLQTQKDFVDMYYNDIVCWLKTKKYVLNTIQTKLQKDFFFQGVAVNQNFKFQSYQLYKQDLLLQNKQIQQQLINSCSFLIIKLIFVISKLNWHYIKEFLRQNKIYKKVLETNFQKIVFIFKEYLPCLESQLTFNYLVQKQLNQVKKNEIGTLLKSIGSYISTYQICQQLQLKSQAIDTQKLQQVLSNYSKQYFKHQVLFSQLYNYMIECLSKKMANFNFKLNLLKIIRQIISPQDISILTKLSSQKLIYFGMSLTLQNIRNTIKNYNVYQQIKKQSSNLKLIKESYVHVYVNKQNYSLVRFLKLISYLNLIAHDFIQFYQFQISYEMLILNEQLLMSKMNQCEKIVQNQSIKKQLFYLKQKIINQIKFNLIKQLYYKFILAFNHHKLDLIAECFKKAQQNLIGLTEQINLNYPSYKFYLNAIKTFFLFFIIPVSLSKQLKKQQITKQFILSVKHNKLVNASELTDIQNMQVNLIPFYFQTYQMKKALIYLEQQQIKTKTNSQTINQLYLYAFNFFVEIQNDKMCKKYKNKLSEETIMFPSLKKKIGKTQQNYKSTIQFLQKQHQTQNYTQQKQHQTQNYALQKQTFQSTNFQDKFNFLIDKMTQTISKKEQIGVILQQIGAILQQIQYTIANNQIYLDQIFDRIKPELNQISQRVRKVTKLQIKCHYLSILLSYSQYLSKQQILKKFKQCENSNNIEFKNQEQPFIWKQLKFKYSLKFQQNSLLEQTTNQLMQNFEKWSVDHYQTYLMVLTILFKMGNNHDQKLKSLFNTIVMEQKIHILFKKGAIYLEFIQILIKISVNQIKCLMSQNHPNFIIGNSFFLFILLKLTQFLNMFPCNNYSIYLNSIFQFSKNVFKQHFKQKTQQIFIILQLYFLQMKNIKNKPEIICFFYMILISINDSNFKQYERVLKKISLNIKLLQSSSQIYIFSDFYSILSSIKQKINKKKQLFFVKLHIRKGCKVINNKQLHYLLKRVLSSSQSKYQLMFLENIKKINELK